MTLYENIARTKASKLHKGKNFFPTVQVKSADRRP